LILWAELCLNFLRLLTSSPVAIQ